MHKVACGLHDRAMLVALRIGNAHAQFLPRNVKHKLLNTPYP